MLRTYTYATPIASVATAFAAGRVATIPLDGPAKAAGTLAYVPGRLVSIQVRVSSLAGSPAPTTLELQACSDAAGDEPTLPVEPATIVTGITTTTEGAVTIQAQGFAPIYTSTAGVLYVFPRVDNGTLTVDSITVVVEV